MPFDLRFQYQKQLTLNASVDDVLSFLKDYSRALPRTFPGLHRFEERQKNLFFWEFEPLEYGGKKLEVTFTTRFQDLGERIQIDPTEESQATALRGYWQVSSQQSHTCIAMLFDLSFKMPFPQFLKSVVSPVAQAELTKLFDRYAKNLQQHFSH